MSGILVAVDGSADSQLALEWAAKEAALRHTSLTVITVHQAVAGFWGGTLNYAGDEALVEKGRQAAQAETDKVLAALGDPARRRWRSRRPRASRPRKYSTRAPTPN